MSIENVYYNGEMEENSTTGTTPVASPISEVHTVPLQPQTKKRPWWKGAWEFLRFIIIVVAIVVVVRVFIAQPFVVSGTSMVPTYENSNYLIIDELTYRFREPQRGDVIVFHPPVDMNTYYIKRIIGVPGDTVTISNSVVQIKNTEHPDGIILKEEYITPDAKGDNFSVTVKDGEYFVMGDNRPASFDSRRWGLLPKKNITGRVFARLLPLKEFGLFPGEHPLY